MFNVYLITNKNTGLVYVGMTSRSVVLRFYEHVVFAYREKNTPLYKAIRLGTPAAFSFSLLADNLSKDEALRLEIYYIQKYQSMDPAKGYNQNLGGSGMRGMRHTDEWRLAHSRRMTGKNHPSYGTRRSAETCAKISKSKKGKRLASRRVFPMDEIQRQYASGLSLRVIAKRYRTEKSVIGSRLRELGVILRTSRQQKKGVIHDSLNHSKRARSSAI